MEAIGGVMKRYQVKNGKIHRFKGSNQWWNRVYCCGLVLSFMDDEPTSKAVTCKSCLRAMKSKQK